MINVNSKQCGAGKTYGWIYPIIKDLLLQDQRVLLVVPSVDLQLQYQSSFAKYITVINNTNSKQVSKAIFDALEDKRQFVCITHQAFEQLSIDLLTKHNYHLIIDEVINPYGMQKINLNRNWTPNFKFKEIFQFDYTDEAYENDTTWYPVNVINPDPNREVPFINESKKWQDLLHRNYNTYMRYADYSNLCNKAKDQAVIIQELKIDTVHGWLSVSVAGAAFESTFMRYWFDNNDVEYTVVEEFEPHITKIRVHTPDKDFVWSKYKKNNHKEILDKYHSYVNAHACNPLVVRNNDEIRTLANEIRVNHNVHGMNLANRQMITSVSLETALVPDQLYKNFLKCNLGMSAGQITNAYSAYLFYQVVLRTAIRDDIPVDIFVLDINTIIELVGYFSNVEVIEKIDVSYKPKKAGRPKQSDESKKEAKRVYMRKYMAEKRKNAC